MKGGGCRLDSGRQNSRAGEANNSSRIPASGIALCESLRNFTSDALNGHCLMCSFASFGVSFEGNPRRLRRCIGGGANVSSTASDNLVGWPVPRPPQDGTGCVAARIRANRDASQRKAAGKENTMDVAIETMPQKKVVVDVSTSNSNRINVNDVSAM